MSMTIVYDGNYENFKKSIEKESGLFINCACLPDGEDTPLYIWLGKEYHPKNKQNEISIKINKGNFLSLAPKELLWKSL